MGMTMQKLGATDLRCIQWVLATDHVRHIERFRRSVGLWFWLPSLLLSLSGFVAGYLRYGDIGLAACILCITLGLCGLGWFARFYFAGSKAYALVPLLHQRVPWDSLRAGSISELELDRINTLEGAMSDQRERRIMSVMPQLIALTSVMSMIVERNGQGR